jgi:hypothetical protein
MNIAVVVSSEIGVLNRLKISEKTISNTMGNTGISA